VGRACPTTWSRSRPKARNERIVRRITGGKALFIPVTDWFPAFLLTLAVEAPLVVLLLRRLEPHLGRLAVLVVTVNLATHLAVWYVFTQRLLPGTVAYVLVAEGWAIGAEALFYWAAVHGLSARRAIAIAAVANATSFLVGRAVAALAPDLLGWRAI
jgi:hypothetical protein